MQEIFFSIIVFSGILLLLAVLILVGPGKTGAAG